MNLYFWIFLCYAVWIVPVRLQLHVRIDHGLHYRIRLQAAGISAVRRKEKEQPETSLNPSGALKSMREWDYALAASMFRRGYVQKLFRTLEWENTEIRIRLSFADAAANAMLYSFLRVFLQSLVCCCRLPLKGGVQMDFRGEGTTVSLRCIALTRLGRLLTAATRLWLAAAAERTKRSALEGKEYAASD